MKKNTFRKARYELVKRRHLDRYFSKLLLAARKKKRLEIKKHRVTVYAPQLLCIYKDRNHTRTTKFLQQLRDACKSNKKVITICFRNTQRVTAAACILMLSEIDRLVSHYGTSKFRVSAPVKKTGRFGENLNVVDLVFHQIGLYKILGKDNSPKGNLPRSVQCWRAESGVVAQSATAGQMLKAITARVSKTTTSSLYRGSIEALANCVEHAYPSPREDGLNIAYKKWWMFTAIVDKRLIVIVCDLGVGIPRTIHTTQSPNLIEQIFTKFGFKAKSDAGWIKTATLVKETRTAKMNRGKGGGDLRNLIKVDTSARLSIFSNKGYYLHTTLAAKHGKGLAAPEFLMDHRNSIFGTIVEWSVEIGN